jgi:hypothetical protein
MSQKYPGGLITKSPVTPSGPYEDSAASGIWTLDQQAYWRKLNQWPIPGNVQPDPQFPNVTMLLHGDGTNGAQNNTFLDTSGNSYSITRNGNTTQGSFSPYGSNWSNYFSDGTYLSVPNNAVFNPGSGDFTVESMFCRTANSGLQTIIAKYESGWQASFSVVISGDTWDVNITYGVGSYALVYSGPAPAVGVWSHFALQRNGSFWEFYCNGVRLAQVTPYTIASTTSAIRIGELGSGYSGYAFNGYISNVRIRNGYATYSGATYTVPTANLTAIVGTALLTCQSNRFVDNSSNNFAVTPGTVSTGSPSVERFNPFGTTTAYSTSVIGGSGYFDGTGDTLSLPGGTFTVTTGDYTVECWAYANSLATTFYDKRIWCVGDSLGNDFELRIGASGSLYFSVNDGGQISASNYKTGTWYHFVLSRVSGTVRLFTNGVLTGSSSASSVSASLAPQFATTFMIGGASFDSSTHWNGYITGFKFTNGSGVTSVTVPTAPVTGGTLLLGMTNGAIFDNAMMNDLGTVGNAQISTSVKKYGTGSLAFDGSGDWLIMPYGPTQNFGTGNFTIEGWFYLNSLAASYYVPAGTWGSGTSDEWLIQIQNDGSIRFLTTSGSTFYSASITTSTWYHIAVVRNGTTVTIYVNGTSVGSYTCSNSLGSVSKTLYIGSQAGSWDWNGYIDDFRITNGYARYTANFTPPTSAFPNIGPT